MYFVDFNSVTNLIVILFNLLYPVFIVGLYCKGCVIEREYVNTQAIEDRKVFASISRLSILRKDAYALHMIGMRRVMIDGDSCVSRVSRGLGLPARHPRNILFCQTVISNSHFLCLHYLYPHYPQMLRSAAERNLSHKPWELEIVIPTYLYTFAYGFSSTPTSSFLYHWEIDSQTLTTSFQSVQWGFGSAEKH